MTEKTCPATFTEARDEMSPFEALTRLAEHQGPGVLLAMRPGEAEPHLSM